MSETSRPDLPPLYSLTAIGIATFLGTALAGGYMLAANYVALGKQRSGMYTIYATCIGLVLFLVIASSFPINATTFVIINVLPVFLLLLVANKLQGPMFSTYEQMGGRYHTVWRTIFIALVASAIYLIPFAAIFGFDVLTPPTP